MATLFEYNNTNDTSEDAIWGDGWMAQTFTSQVSHTITSVKLLLWRFGSPGTVTVSIRATNIDGEPTGGDLASGTTDGDTLPTGSPYEWREISLGAALNAGTMYAIVVRAPSGDTNNEIYWRENNNQYASGIGYTSGDSGSTWSSMGTWDCLFEDWGVSAFIPWAVVI